MTCPDGGVLSTAYDADGNAITQTNALGRATVSSYDLLNRLTAVTDPRGGATTYHYDADGRVITTTNALGQQSVASYDAAGEQTGLTQADGSVLHTAYDAAGEVITSTDALGRATVYSYDPLGRVASSTDPLARTTSYQYDLAGNRVGLTDAMSRTTTYGFNAVNELTGIHYGDGQTPNVAYTYTATGQRASMADGTGTTTYGYDALDRPITTTNGAGQTLGYGYDAVGNPTRLTYPDGSAITRSYDTLDRLSGITDWLGHTTQFGYDRDSNLITATVPTTSDVTTIAQGYNAADQLTAITATQAGGTLWNASYGRDLLGQVITSTDTLDGKGHSYSYSPLAQLTADRAVSGTATITQTWSPDSADELTARTDPSGATAHAYGYDAASEVLTDTVGGATTTYSYDRAGNRTGQQNSADGSSARYGYDQADRLTSAVISTTAGITPASYLYDGDGVRQSKTVTTTSGVTTTAEVWDTSGALPLLVQDGTTKYLSGPDGLPLEQLDGGGHVAYDLHDQLGSTRVLLDGAGNTLATFTYDAYGNVTAPTGNGLTTPFGFAGQYTDAETGWQYLRARYYDPRTGQFTSVDPLVAQTGQPYAYAADDPLTMVDPTGLGCRAAIGGLSVELPVGDSGDCGAQLRLRVQDGATSALCTLAPTCLALDQLHRWQPQNQTISALDSAQHDLAYGAARYGLATGQGAVQLGLCGTPVGQALDPQGCLALDQGLAQTAWHAATTPPPLLAYEQGLGLYRQYQQDAACGHPGRFVGQVAAEAALAVAGGGEFGAADAIVSVPDVADVASNAANAVRLAQRLRQEEAASGLVHINQPDEAAAAVAQIFRDPTSLQSITPSSFR